MQNCKILNGGIQILQRIFLNILKNNNKQLVPSLFVLHIMTSSRKSSKHNLISIFDFNLGLDINHIYSTAFYLSFVKNYKAHDLK